MTTCQASTRLTSRRSTRSCARRALHAPPGGLGVGHPVVSRSLARLRDHFKDELLVLKGRTYVLTVRAEKLASVVANATRSLAEVFDDQLELALIEA